MKLGKWLHDTDLGRWIPSLLVFVICYLLSVLGALCIPRGTCVDFASAAGVATISTCLFVASWPFLLGRIAKVFLLLLIAYLCAVVSVKAFLNLVMNMGECDLGVEWVGILLNSSWREVGEFVERFCWRVDVLVGVICMLTILALSLTYIVRCQCPRCSLSSISIGLVFALPFVAMNFVGIPGDDALSSLLFDVRFNCNVGQGYEQYREIATASRNTDFSSPPRYVPRSQTPPVFVIVIGESATRNHWGLYGYCRDTTPQMSGSANRLTVFKHARATHPFTATSLKHIFTDATSEKGSVAHYAFPQMLKAAGFKTTLISTQNHWGQYDGVDAILFESCDSKVFLADNCRNGICLDGETIPVLKDALAARRSAPLAVFVHLIGSHFIFSDRYPAGFDPFGAGAMVDGKQRRVAEYDNSIAYTDCVLGNILAELQGVNAPVAMLYFSDHGESFGDVYRSMSDPDMYEIPMIAWCSADYRIAAPDIVTALDDSASCHFGIDRLLRGLCRLCWIEWDGLLDEYDFLSVTDAPEGAVK